MKKFLAMLLAALMMMGACSALAESSEVVEAGQAIPEFNVTMTLPEGYSMIEERNGDVLIVTIESEDEEAPSYLMSIAYSELYDGRSLVDMDQQEQDALVAMFAADDFYAADISDFTTTGGSKVYVLDEQEADSDFAVCFTIYKGYFIQMSIIRPGFANLTVDDVQRAIDLLSGMEFVDAE